MFTYRSRGRAAVAVLSTAAAAILNVALIAAPAARADDASTLTVVGTSDVSDSNLVASVIKPGFEAAYPGITLNYVPLGSGQAIAYAEQGSASALLVHAASLENQFVGAGYSNEAFGRAIFWGDYVLLGPADDPAHVMTSDQHDIAGAFEKIAAAGAAGNANFVSRGGTSGTSVQEHAIWNLTSGVTTCTVDPTNGGGTMPFNAAEPCPANPQSSDYPSWYHTTAANQAANIENADACNGYDSPHKDDCYAFTDRGTFEYLESQHELSHLQIVTRDNAASARGGVPLLVNSFHAYAINPAKFTSNSNVHINETGAEDLLNWITSPAAQTEIGTYLSNAGGAAFLPDAAPKITVVRSATTVASGKKLTISGTVSNVVPGTPPLVDEPVYLRNIPRSTSLAVTTQKTVTNSSGRYSFSVTPTRTASYSVSTKSITQTENSTLHPIFGDILQGTTVATGTTHVKGHIAIAKHSVSKKRVLTVSGSLAPKVAGHSATIRLYGAKVGHSLRVLRSWTVKIGSSSFDLHYTFPKGHVKYELQFSSPTVFDTDTTDLRHAKVS